MQYPRRLVLLLSLVLTVAAPAAEPHPLTPQDLWALKRVSAPALSPDGRTVALVVQEWSVSENKATANL